MPGEGGEWAWEEVKYPVDRAKCTKRGEGGIGCSVWDVPGLKRKSKG